MDCSIIITTKDRVSDLQKSLDSCLEQSEENEIIVTDDKGRLFRLKTEFPCI